MWTKETLIGIKESSLLRDKVILTLMESDKDVYRLNVRINDWERGVVFTKKQRTVFQKPGEFYTYAPKEHLFFNFDDLEAWVMIIRKGSKFKILVYLYGDSKDPLNTFCYDIRNFWYSKPKKEANYEDRQKISQFV